MVRREIRITHVSWRDGRPRFQPGPKLRALGFKGCDLKRPDGTWMDDTEALLWVTEKAAAIDDRRAAATSAADAGKRLAPLRDARGRKLLSTEDLIEAFLGSVDAADLAAKTLKSYRYFKGLLGTFDGDIFTGPVEALTQPIVYDLYGRLVKARGLASARGVISTLSTAISWGLRAGKVRFGVNPCLRLRMKAPKVRVRVWTPDELRAFVATADRIGRPEIGDAAVLGCWTGQRQADRLALIDKGLVDGRRIFRQAKTGAIVAIPPAPMLEARLAAARARREAWPVQPLTIIVDEHTRTSFKADWYRQTFTKVRKQAAEALPSLATATDQDLRDTAVTWLARARCTIPEICAITGHDFESATRILKHYLALHPELADNAIAKLVAWYEEQESN